MAGLTAALCLPERGNNIDFNKIIPHTQHRLKSVYITSIVSKQNFCHCLYKFCILYYKHYRLNINGARNLAAAGEEREYYNDMPDKIPPPEPSHRHPPPPPLATLAPISSWVYNDVNIFLRGDAIKKSLGQQLT